MDKVAGGVSPPEADFAMLNRVKILKADCEVDPSKAGFRCAQLCCF